MFELNTIDLAKRLNQKHHHIVVDDEIKDKTTSFVYNEAFGAYERVSPMQLQRIIADELCENSALCKPSIITDTYKFMLMYARREKFSNFDANEKLILCANGIYDLNTAKLIPHDSKYLFTRKNSGNYIKISKENLPMKTIKFINELSNNDKDVSELLWEIIGLTISNIPGYKAKKLIVLCGPGNTGKSVFRNLLTELVGDEYNSGCTLEQMNGRFGLSSIYNKRIVGSADMPFQRNQSISLIKTLTGGDSIDIEYKGLTSFSSKFNGVLCFCSNELPLFAGDKGKHVYERFIIIKCDNAIPKEKRNSNLLKELLEERDKILSYSILHLHQFINNGYSFHIPDSVNNCIDEFKYENSPEIQFFLEKCILEGNKKARKPSAVVFQEFKEYCKIYFPKYVPNKKDFVSILSEYLGEPIEDRTHSQRQFIFTLKDS